MHSFHVRLLLSNNQRSFLLFFFLYRKIYQQIDIAPTLSVLLGLPIPSSSIGTLIPELLEGLSHDEQLVALYYNTHRLYRKLERYKTREYGTVEPRLAQHSLYA